MCDEGGLLLPTRVEGSGGASDKSFGRQCAALFEAVVFQMPMESGRRSLQACSSSETSSAFRLSSKGETNLRESGRQSPCHFVGLGTNRVEKEITSLPEEPRLASIRPLLPGERQRLVISVHALSRNQYLSPPVTFAGFVFGVLSQAIVPEPGWLYGLFSGQL